MQQKRLETPGGAVAYWVSDEWGDDRPTLFFFHGFSSDHTMFRAQVRFFKDQCNMIVWDAPCHGLSRPFSSFTMAQAAQFIEDIAACEGVDSFVAVGQSFGGYFVQALLCRNPSLVCGFIAIDACPYGVSYYTQSDYKKLLKGISQCKLVPWTVLRTASATTATATDAGYQNMLAMVSSYTKHEYIELMRTCYTAFIDDNQDVDIPCPVLLMYGEDDTIGQVRECCDTWHERTGYPLIVISHAGHNAHVDNPDEVNEMIQAFVEGLF